MQVIKAKSILQKVGGHSNQWFGIDYNINLYKGCSHGCIYCDSRSSCYQIDHFDEVRIKDNEIAILNKELQSKKKKGVVGIGAMSDTYNPFEKNLEITRQALKLLQFYHFGVSIDTKSDLVVRDIDILKQMKNVIIKFT
ncbi:MAG: radical SAM protein, partial [Beduini sp.]